MPPAAAKLARRLSIEKQTRVLPRSFYGRPAIEVAPELLGKVIVHKLDGVTLAGMIVEAEAYLGVGDLAAHASRGLTNRTRVLFGPPGHTYVYFIYGMYECLNIVCEADGSAGCILIRALEPLAGIDEMQRRRPKAKRPRDLTSGPGKLTMAMGITRQLYGADVTRGNFQVREFIEPPRFETVTATRIGLSVCEDLPLRFYIKDNEFVSVK
jgi:DNA-3-methyladenine glycosylase